MSTKKINKGKSVMNADLELTNIRQIQEVENLQEK
jgi:hypothetical protein